MYAHTPGPWEARRDPSHFDTLSSVVGGGTWTTTLKQELMVEAGGFGPPLTQEANTRLISAAPELLEALESLYAMAATGMNDPDTYNKAKAAIAKAKGESQ